MFVYNDKCLTCIDQINEALSIFYLLSPDVGWADRTKKKLKIKKNFYFNLFLLSIVNKFYLLYWQGHGTFG